ncbi:MAG: hypothetical protein ABIY50_11275 [Ignavibacteria bacterium]
MKIKPVHFLILLLTLISFQTISQYTILPDIGRRINIQDSILSGQMEAPYQYRLVKPFLGYSLQTVFTAMGVDKFKAHEISYRLLIFVVFLGIYSLFYKYLKNFFPDNICMVGLLMLQAVIPLGISSIWEEGDYITLLIYLIGFNLMFKNKDQYMPLLIGVGMFNRDQVIFLLAFYALYLYSENRLFDRRSFFIIFISFSVAVIAYLIPRFAFGFLDSKYTVLHNTSTNITFWKQITELWIAEVLIFVILCLKVFKKSIIFFKISLICLGIYVIIFFFNGIMTQLAKFLPAFLILIPMSLQFFKHEVSEEYNPQLPIP